MSGPGPSAGPGSYCLSCGPEGRGSLLLHCLRQSEAKRLELERKLMEYRKSDAYLMKLKYRKLKTYLKELDERQRGALLRNQTFLKEFDQFEAHLETSGSAMIQKMEAWYRREIKSALSLQEGDSLAGGAKEEDYGKQVPCVGSQSVTGTEAVVPGGQYQSSILADGGLGMQQKPPQSTESHTATSPSLCSLPLEGLGSENRGSAPDLPSCSSSLEGLGPESIGADLECDASVDGEMGHGDMSASKESYEQITSLSDPKPSSPKEEQPLGSVPGPKPCPTDWWTSKEASWESSDELLVPVSTKEVTLNTSDLPWETVSPVASWKQDRDVQDVEGSSQQLPNLPVGQEEPSASSTPNSFCNWDRGLKENDLEACEAIVLHKLQVLLQSTSNSCLLPEEALKAEGTAVDEKQSRPGPPWDVDVLQTHLSHHSSFLRQHQVQLPDSVEGMLESPLPSNEGTQDSQVLTVLREMLPKECGNRSSPQSNESSCSLPVIPDNGVELKQANHASQLASTGEQEVTSWCEDESKEESTVEKIPITGFTFTTSSVSPSSYSPGWGSSDNSSKSQEAHSDTCSSPKEQRPLFSRTEMRKGVTTAIKSKAFWGESDDSSSEIEAALCPQTGSPEASDDFDFYD